jgi:DNA-binding winged helix-turn-helix (wHTH) protein/tetratricopeptide (TPR) repeat protein
MIVFPPFRLEPGEGRLWKGKTLLALRRKPFAILSYLASRPRQLVTHEELLAQVWRGAVVSDSAMRSHLHELRQVLGEGVIETVIGRGYRFVAELRDEVAPEPLRDAVAVDPLVVGRDQELGQLRAAFERALSGRRQLCFVTGEPGIGKSTLVRTFLAGLDATVLVAQGACFEQHGAPEPYLALIDALSALSRSGRGAQAMAALVRHAPTFVSQVPQLLSDEQLAEASRRAAFGNEARQLRELSAALEAICVATPLVLVIEDLQWSDVATIDLLSLLGQRQERAKLLVIGTSRYAEIQRPEHPLNHVMRTLVARSGALALRLASLDLATVQSFIDRRFAGHAFSPELSDAIAKTTGGTPLYVVSLLEELASRGLLAERQGQWRLAVSLDELRAHRPASVKQLIDMQLDRLATTEQRVLEAASVVGTEFPTHLVAAALELSVEEVDDTCDALSRRALFLRAEPDGRYRVTHALVQEVCIDRGSPARRQRWHRLVAEALQRDPLAGDVSHLLAQHFAAAGDAARAIPAYAAAARQAGQRYASSDAVALCARALALLPQLPASPERDVVELEILEAMCRQVNSNSFSAVFAGRDPRAIYERAIALSRALGDVSRVYAATTRFCNYYMIVAQYARATELTAELERLEQAHELDPSLLHGGIFARGYIAFYRGELSAALRAFEQLAPAVEQPSVFHGNLAGRVLALAHLACARWVVGEPERALEEAQAALELANQIEVPILQALGHVARARLRYLQRDLLPVEQESEQAVAAAALDFGLHTEASAFALWARAQRGALSLAAIAPMLDVLQQRLNEVSTCSTLVALALIDVLVRSGHAGPARELSDQIIAFARAHDENVYLPELLRLRGEQLEATDTAAALRDYHDAVELARRTGARSLEQRAADNLAALTGKPSPSI